MKRNRSIPATRAQQPPRPRARDTFSCVVDDTAPNVMPFTPPLTIQPLTPATLDRNAIRGENLTHNSNTTEKGAPTKRAPHIAPWQHRAFAQTRLPRGFSRCNVPRCNGEVHQHCSGENSLPTRDIKGQDNRGHPPTVTLVSPRHAPPAICRLAGEPETQSQAQPRRAYPLNMRRGNLRAAVLCAMLACDATPHATHFTFLWRYINAKTLIFHWARLAAHYGDGFRARHADDSRCANARTNYCLGEDLHESHSGRNDKTIRLEQGSSDYGLRIPYG